MLKRMAGLMMVAGLTGCASLAAVPTSSTAGKAAGSVCATAGAAMSSIALAAPQLDAQAQALHVKLQPYCDAGNPTAALTSAEMEAYTALIALAAPYMGGGK